MLRDVSLELGGGEMVALLGANGSGKTTLLRLLLGLLRADVGLVLLDDAPILSMPRRAIARRIAYVPQRHLPTFPFTVAEMVAMGRVSITGWAGKTSGASVAQTALDRVGIGHLARRAYTTLSGGEQQSVLIARAMMQGADILLLDEPTAALDPGQSAHVLSLLRQLAAHGLSVLATTHDPTEALRTFSRALVLSDGRIIADGPCADVLDAETLTRCYGVRIALMQTTGLVVPAG
ncbi:ABC transporter ATP-binding protein [Sphingomonas nostoxanthinifaciens]|uniref:ABC transporter ATP-binding protein n=1 Tax=Sphingomonas nostoxanthinifaciens TaxID=2872652 RepID=UPI001CC1FE4A|nr:ABC transporter ATP-binding protein [Sphingomonas nostoxanthinifaciens]UAK25819.1 ABC transporter ATP-binding protein [Sphingomonas nostoxanthinifaciens]